MSLPSLVKQIIQDIIYKIPIYAMFGKKMKEETIAFVTIFIVLFLIENYLNADNFISIAFSLFWKLVIIYLFRIICMYLFRVRKKK